MALAMELVVLLALPLLLLLLLWILKAPSSPVQIRDRHILITGGSSGIGLELAKLVVSEGARKVTLLARNMERLQDAQKQVAALAGDHSTEIHIVSADVVDLQSLQRAIEEAGPVDVLVCSHGISIPCAFEEASQEDMHRVVDINYIGTMNVVKAVLPGMLEDNGTKYARSIAMFSSQAAQAGIFGYAPYAGTKAAIVAFAQALKQELFLRNIQVSVIYPPDTDTPGFREESKFKPEITAILSSSSSAMEAIDVARVSLKGIKAGKFNVACNFDGHLLAIACSGMSPQTSAADAARDILLAPFVRIIAICVQYGWFRTIRQCDSKQKKLK